MPAAIEVVELRLRDRVVDVDCREQQIAILSHLRKAQNAGRRLFRHTLDASGNLRVALSVLGQRALQQAKEHLEFFRLGVGRVGNGASGLILAALVDQHRRVATVVEDHVRTTVRPVDCLLGAPPVLLQRLTLPGEDRNAGRLVDRSFRANDYRSGCVVLSREDVARAPANLGAERNQGLDQHGGLDRHVQRAGDAGSLQRLSGGELFARLHQPWHLVLGKADLLAAKLGVAKIGNLVVVVGEYGGGGH